jgi:hypothetical protein
MPWLATLRGRGFSAQSALAAKRKAKMISTVPNPPSFYDDEMQKWQNKFKKSVQERADYKKKNFKDTVIGLHAQAGDKIMELIHKRRKSRLSTNNFSNVDIDYEGDTKSFYHMIKKGARGHIDKTEINFNCKLRTYKSKTE